MVTTSPTARRISSPSWLDTRLVLGVLLVIGSVLIGATVVSRAHHTSPVVTAAHDLAAGTVLTAGDLATVDMQLDGRSAAQYAARASDLLGRELQRPVSAGELVPRRAVVHAPALTTLPVSFATGYAPSLRAGQRVELWVSSPTCPSVVLLPDVTVQSVRDLDAGFGSSNGQSIVISVQPSLAQRVITAQALDDAHIRAGILTGDRGTPAALPDISSCAPATSR